MFGSKCIPSTPSTTQSLRTPSARYTSVHQYKDLMRSIPHVSRWCVMGAGLGTGVTAQRACVCHCENHLRSMGGEINCVMHSPSCKRSRRVPRRKVKRAKSNRCKGPCILSPARRRQGAIWPGLHCDRNTHKRPHPASLNRSEQSRISC